MASKITEFAHLQIPLEDVRKATNNFAEKNIIGKGGFGNVYKGKLIVSGESIKIAARRLDRKSWQGDVEFWTEISMLSSLKHDNIVSIIGYCDENGEKIAINKYEAKISLLTYIENEYFDFHRRLNVIKNVVQAILYIHEEAGQNYYVIHRNINSSTILVEFKSGSAKLSGFEYCIKDSKDRMNQVFLTESIDSQVYMDPEALKNGGVTHKSDIYSLGVVLLEILCGRKADDDKMLPLVPLAKSHYEKGTLRKMIPFHVSRGMSPYWFECLAILAYSCLQEEREKRPDAAKVLYQIQDTTDFIYFRDMDELYYDAPPPKSKYEEASFYPTKMKKLEHLRIGLREIELATNSFSKKYEISNEKFYTMYKAKLKRFDRLYCSSVEEKNKDDLPKTKREYNVKIKHIKHEEYTSFNTEIEILNSCKHRNIESLLGFCDEGRGMILVFEYDSDSDTPLITYLQSDTLTWEKSLKLSLDVAYGLCYLHNGMEDQKTVIHRHMTHKSVLLDKSGAHIIDFRYSVFLPQNQDNDALHLNDNYGTTLFTDPEYTRTGKLKRESDVFSFGALMFIILCGMSADDILLNEGRQDTRLEQVVGRWFKKGIIKKKIATILKKENSANDLFLLKGPNEDSLDTFINIAYQCLAETQKCKIDVQQWKSSPKNLRELYPFKKITRIRLECHLKTSNSPQKTSVLIITLEEEVLEVCTGEKLHTHMVTNMVPLL